MNHYLKFFRAPSLLVIVFTLLAIKYALFEPFQIDTVLDNFHFILLILATVCIAAAGSIILRIFNATNTQHATSEASTALVYGISEKKAYTFFVVLNVIGVSIGFYLAYHIDKSGFSSLFILISALLYIYASYLKQLPFIGNLVVGLLVALVPLIPGLFDLLPAINLENKAVQSTIFSVLMDYAALALIIATLHEIVKDCRDIDQDHNTGMNTIPMLLGRDRTIKIIGIITLLPIGMIFWYCYTYLFHNSIAIGYGLLMLIAPLLYFIIKCWSAENKKHFSLLSKLLKIVLFFTILSIALYRFVLITN